MGREWSHFGGVESEGMGDRDAAEAQVCVSRDSGQLEPSLGQEFSTKSYGVTTLQKGHGEASDSSASSFVLPSYTLGNSSYVHMELFHRESIDLESNLNYNHNRR